MSAGTKVFFSTAKRKKTAKKKKKTYRKVMIMIFSEFPTFYCFLRLYYILSVCCCLIIVRHLDFLGEFKIRGWSFCLVIAHFRVWVMLPYSKQCSILLIIINISISYHNPWNISLVRVTWLKNVPAKTGEYPSDISQFAKAPICGAKIFEGW